MRELNDIERRIVSVAKEYVQSDWWEEGPEAGISKEITGTLPDPTTSVTIPAVAFMVSQFVALDRLAGFIGALEAEFNKDMPGVLRALTWQISKLQALEQKIKDKRTPK